LRQREIEEQRQREIEERRQREIEEQRQREEAEARRREEERLAELEAERLREEQRRTELEAERLREEERLQLEREEQERQIREASEKLHQHEVLEQQPQAESLAVLEQTVERQPIADTGCSHEERDGRHEMGAGSHEVAESQRNAVSARAEQERGVDGVWKSRMEEDERMLWEEIIEARDQVNLDWQRQDDYDAHAIVDKGKGLHLLDQFLTCSISHSAGQSHCIPGAG
jgi:hypothetical protein